MTTLSLIAPSVIIAMFLESAFAFLLPIALLLFWQKKTGARIAPFFVGAGIFFLFAMVLEQILHALCLMSDNPVSRAIRGSVVLYALYGAFAAGIFEETGRFVAFKLMKRHASREVSVTYGIGHGGIEAMLLVGVNMLIYGVCALLLNSGGAQALALFGPETQTALVPMLQSLTVGTCAIGAWERLSTVIFHIAMSVLVFAAVHQPGKWYLYPLAILLHAGVDLFAVLFQVGVLQNMILVEVLIMAFSLLCALLAWRIYRALPSYPAEEPKRNSLIGSVAVVILLSLYLICFGGAVLLIPGLPVLFRVVLCGVLLGIIILLITLLVQRIHEVNSGELDDLDRY